MTTAAVPPPENDPPKDMPKKAPPRRVGPVRCGVCGNPATRHSNPPSILAMCDSCSTFDPRFATFGLFALVASTPQLVVVAFWTMTLLISAAFVVPVIVGESSERKSPPPVNRAGTR